MAVGPSTGIFLAARERFGLPLRYKGAPRTGGRTMFPASCLGPFKTADLGASAASSIMRPSLRKRWTIPVGDWVLRIGRNFLGMYVISSIEGMTCSNS